MSETLCCLCGKWKVMGGVSSTAKKAQRLKLCSTCYGTKGASRKAAEKLGLPYRRARGSAKRPRKPRATKPAPRQPRDGTPRGVHTILHGVIDALEVLATEVEDLAGVVEKSTSQVEEHLVFLNKRVAHFSERSAGVRARLTAVEEKLSRAVKKLGEAIPEDNPDARPSWDIPGGKEA